MSWDLGDMPSLVEISGKGEVGSASQRDVHFTLTYSGHGIEATDQVWFSVVRIVWMPLGEATGLNRFTIGRVYVPTKYGGTLKLDGSGSALYYKGDLVPADNYNAAVRIVKGLETPTESGNPCTHEADYGEFRWFYVAVDGQANMCPGFSQTKTDLPVPWACPLYPIPAVQGGNLYAEDGPLHKYDLAFSAGSRAREKRNWLFVGGIPHDEQVDGHYVAQNAVSEFDAEVTWGYDIDNADGDGDETTGLDASYRFDFVNTDWNEWVGEIGRDPETGELGLTPQDGISAVIPTYWWGHCDEACAVSILESEPQGTYQMALPPPQDPVTFSPMDKKGLLVALYHGMGRESDSGPDVLPAIWHKTIEQYLLASEDASPVVFDWDNTGEGDDVVWNYPLYKVILSYGQQRDVVGDGPERVRVVCFAVAREVYRVDEETGQLSPDDRSFIYSYNILYGSDGMPVPVRGPGEWRDTEMPPDRIWSAVRQTAVSNSWLVDYARVAQVIPLGQ